MRRFLACMLALAAPALGWAQMIEPSSPLLDKRSAFFDAGASKARAPHVVWVYAGAKAKGKWTAARIARMLERDPNLSIGLRLGPGPAPGNAPYTDGVGLRPEWAAVFERFPDRFLIAPGAAKRDDVRLTHLFIESLPATVARKIAVENARRIYGLAPAKGTK
jgi:hypothetical protein